MPKPLRKASFGGITFAYSRIRYTGGIRHHVHEFPHSPGGEIEKMGRSLYQVEIEPIMHDLEGSDLELLFPKSYPDNLDELRLMFEHQETKELVTPHLDAFDAVCVNWTGTIEGKNPSGETVTWTFREDDDRERFGELDETAAYAQLDAENIELLAQVALSDYFAENPTGLFQQISDVVTSIQAISGVADAYDQILLGKVASLVNLCSQASRELTGLGDPANLAIYEALKNVWSAAVDIASDIGATKTPLAFWTVPKTMAVSEIASRLGQTVEGLLQLNGFEDSFAVRAGTLVQYYRTS